MKPYISMITLGVTDLHRSVRFYQEGLGLHTEGIMGEEFAQGTVAFFDLQQGLKLALWPRQSLAADAGLPLSASTTAMSLAHNVLTETDVDAIMQQAAVAGATIVKPPQKHSGAVMPVIFRIRMATYGKLYGIRIYCLNKTIKKATRG